MLILPQSIYQARLALWRKFEAGKITAAEAYRQMLELDPDDHIGMLGLGRLCREAGDYTAAADYFWRAIQAQPCAAVPYLELATTPQDGSDWVAMADALSELGFARKALEDETFAESLDFEKAGITGEALEQMNALPVDTRAEVLLAALRAKREDEPAVVTARLRSLRLLQQVQEEGDLPRKTVDAIIAEGESMAPLLVGVLRGWGQDLLGEDGDSAMENALGLLGETGSTAEIPHLLEFVDLTNEAAAGASAWALGRIMERDPEGAAQVIASLAAGLGPAERLAVAEQILRHPELDSAATLLERLSENIAPWKRADRDAFFPTLLGAMAAARGEEGVNLGRAALRREGGLLSHDARRECEDLLAALLLQGVPPVSMGPSLVTVYEICAGDAVWETGEDEEDEEDEDSSLVPEPVRRVATPGRNDPCWCNSGKKYKKCHLDSDERERLAPRDERPVWPRTDEFQGLRTQIGEFFGQALPKREMARACEEFLGGEEPADDDEDLGAFVADWTLHDWVAPKFGRTVLEEFVLRRGSRLSEREREMVEAWSRSSFAFYEVQELKSGTGLTLKNLISGETFFVHDVSLSKAMARWDGLLARVVPGERGTELSGIGMRVPRQNMEPLRQWIEEDRGEGGPEWREYLKANWPRIRRRSFEIAAEWLDALQLANSDGEQLLLSKAVYRMSNGDAVLAAARSCAEFENETAGPDAREHFVWLNEKKTVLGNVRVGSDELELACNSRERLERGKVLLVGLAGDSLRHLRDEITTAKDLKRRAAEGPRGKQPDDDEIPKELRDEAVARYLDDHYGGWPDMELPALRGKTPREAVRTPKGRKEVIAVLKSIENGEDRKRQAGEPYYDVAKLRAELGL